VEIGVSTIMTINAMKALPLRHAVTAFAVLLFSGCCLGQGVRSIDLGALVLPRSATEVKRFDERCHELDYVVSSTYPGTDILNLISDELRRQGWSRVDRVAHGLMRNPGTFKSAGKWEHFKNITGTTTYTRAEQWKNPTGDVVSYNFYYENDDLKHLSVLGLYCDHEFIAEHQCIPGSTKPYDPQRHALSVEIDRIERDGNDFKVFVKIRNIGTEAVLVGLNGKLPDGKPELWVLNLEQEEGGEWGYVGITCAEHPALDWITLKPGADVESWAMAVDFPEPNHRWAKCHREIGHLHGRVRASIYYYTGVCEITNPVEDGTGHLATSEPVALPVKPR